ncbi:MAG: glycosyltransferase family 2 protein [Bacteroidota bacterium]
MLVSIIIPVYKVEEYIHQCIKSILSQEYNNLEIILIDDGSPDNCGLICDNYAKTDSRIKVIHQENAGLSAARNSGLKEATGDYIWFVDSDDWIKEGAISLIVNVLKKEQVEMLGFSYIEYFENGDYFSKPFLLKTISTTNSNNYIKENGMFVASAWCYIYNSSFLKSKNLSFNEKIIHEDDYFNLICFSEVKTIKKIPFGLYYYRKRENSIISSQVSNQKIISFVELIRLGVTLRTSNLNTNFIEKQIFGYTCVLFSLLNKVVSLTSKEKFKIIDKVKSIVPDQLILKNDSGFVVAEKYIYNNNKRLFYYYINYFRSLRYNLEYIQHLFSGNPKKLY